MNGQAPEKIMKIFLFFLFIGLATNDAIAQRYSFVNYTTRNGLVQSNITDIKQDSNGNIWIGTQGGLSIFDGRKFTNFDDRDVLQSLNILSILCDSAGMVWVGTGNGLLLYDHQFKTVFQPKDTIQARTSSLSSYGNLIYFICNNRIYEITKDRKIKPVYVNGDLENIAAFSAFDIHGNLWIITNTERVYRVTNKKVKEFSKPAYIEKFYSNSFGFIRLNGNTDSEPYFISNFGTLMISGDTLGWFAQRYPRFFNMGVTGATFVLKDRDSVRWVGANRGLVKLMGFDSAVRFNKLNGFGDHSVSTILRDREDNLWIGSTYYGVYKLSNEALFNIPPTEKAEFKNISYSGKIDENTTFVGTWGSGPFLLKDQEFIPVEYMVPKEMHPPGFNYITAVCHVGNTTYIGCLSEGIWKLENGSTKLCRLPLKEGEAPIDNIIRYHDGFLVQAQNGSSYIYDDQFNLLRASKTLMSMIRMVGDNLYHLESIGNTSIIDSNFNRIKEDVFPEINSEISQIAAYNGKTIVSTLGEGIFIYDSNGKLSVRINKKNGLNSNVVTSLLVDGYLLFAGTNYGLVQVNLQDRKIRIFNENEGMFNSECRRQGLLKISGNVILIPTTNGPYLYYPALDNTASLAKGYIQLVSLTAQGDRNTIYFFNPKDTPTGLSQKIPFSRNEISIAFKGVSQRAPESIEYHYRLAGSADSSWKLSKEEAPVEYHQLPPGNYVFTIYIKVKDFISPASSVSFTVKKPLQGEWWFQLLVLSIIAGLVLFFLHFLNRLYQKLIQTRMTDEFSRSVKRKNSQIVQSVEDARQNIADLKQMHFKHNFHDAEELNSVYVDAGLMRMQLLVQHESITLKGFHDYFDEVMSIPGKAERRIYQEISDPSLVIPMDKAFSLMEIFSLYMIWKLSGNPHFLFSLNSEVRSNNRLVIRCYQLNSLNISLPSTLEAGFRKMMKKMKDEHWSIAFIENPETSSMLIIEMEI